LIVLGGHGDALLRNPTTGIAGCWARAASGHAAAPSEQSDERPPLHSINSSARASSFAGLKGRAGDAANVILSAVGYNLRLVLAWLRMILRVVLLALPKIFAIQPVLKPAS
jgi:hypothetical protein